MLELVASPKYGQTGLFPELFFFDCHACHKPMSANRWQERASLGLGPGVVRFNDANLIMLKIAAGAVDGGLADRIAKGRSGAASGEPAGCQGVARRRCQSAGGVAGCARHVPGP